MGDVAAIILAAGLSRRMGNRNKLLLPINGMPMIRHMVMTYWAATKARVLVVTGHEAEAVENSLKGCDVQTIYNPDFAEGQQTSVACGLRNIGDATQILIGLGDQPRLTAKDLTELLTVHKAADPARISIPMLGEQRGNPIVVSGILRARLLEDPRSPGCKKFTRANPDHVQFHALKGRGFYSDVDTPQAYDAIAAENLEETK